MFPVTPFQAIFMDFPRARTLMSAIAVLVLAACVHSAPQPEPQPELAPVVSSPQPEAYIHDALHWARNSAERRAIFEQTFELAAHRLEALAEGREPGTWGISADADETLIDNSQFEVEIRSRGETFSPEAWNAWVERRDAAALPGAVEFTRLVKALGGVVAVVTNRDASHCGPTADNMKTIGIAFDVALCRAGGDSEKEPRWDALEKGAAGQWPQAQIWGHSAPGPVTVLMWLGDNVGDFPMQNQDVRYSAEPLTDFGDRFFMFPNPVYGSWEDNPRQ